MRHNVYLIFFHVITCCSLIWFKPHFWTSQLIGLEFILEMTYGMQNVEAYLLRAGVPVSVLLSV